jgi:hypothetical protein
VPVFRDVPSFENKSVSKVGDHIQTVTLTTDRLIVEYAGPPIPEEVQAELAEYFRERLDRIMRAAFFAGSHAVTQVPAAPGLAEPCAQRCGMVVLSGPWI